MSNNSSNVRFISFYLPQFHPIPENNKYWGNGFTEWTNVAKAKPLFKGHEQPRIPLDTGFYDLRLPETRALQAELAKEAGIEGFCYWHYYFGNGKEVLQTPLDEVVKSKEPNYPFCIGWALHDWTTKTWEKGRLFSKNSLIFKQEFPGFEDDVKHFNRLLPIFNDNRYIKVDGKLLFVIFNPDIHPYISDFISLWNDLAKKNGLVGFHFVADITSLGKITVSSLRELDKTVDERINFFLSKGFDAVETINFRYAEIKSKGIFNKVYNVLIRKYLTKFAHDRYDYRKVMKYWFSPSDKRENVYPQVVVGWDRSPRAGRKAVIYYNDTPEEFGKVIDKACEIVSMKKEQHRIIFLHSWNEWGEGAYLEPDLRFGKGKLLELKKRTK